MNAQKCYRARLDYTGEIFSGDFKWVFEMAMASLRGDLHDCVFYTFRSVVIEEGIEWEDNGSYHWDAIRPVCMISGSGVDHVVHTYIDRM